MARRVETRPTKGWALAHPFFGINLSSCRWMRRDVVTYANSDAAPGWDLARYRKSGWQIVRVIVSPVSAQKEKAEE